MSKKLLPRAATAERYGRHFGTIKRWEENPDLGFPKPIRILGKIYYDSEERDAFDEAQRAKDDRAPDLLKPYRDHRDADAA